WLRELPLPRVQARVSDRLAIDPALLELISLGNPLVLIGPDPAGGFILVGGLGTWAVARALGERIESSAAIRAFLVPREGSVAAEVIAAMLLSGGAGFSLPLSRGDIAAHVILHLGWHRSEVAALLGLTRQAIAAALRRRNRPRVAASIEP